MMKRPAFDHAVRGLSSLGYRYYWTSSASARPPLQVAEVPYVFRTRLHGESKLDSAVTWEYLMLLLDKTIGGTIPVRFAMFTLVGGVGLLVHMFVLAILDVGLQYSFVTSQIAATLVAMTFNFFVNNILTYRDQRLKGARAAARRTVQLLRGVRDRSDFQRRHRGRACSSGTIPGGFQASRECSSALFGTMR